MILKNPHVVIDGNDLSAYVLQASLDLSNEAQDDTRDNATQRYSEPGLNVVGCEIELSQAFAAVDAVLYPLWQAGTEFVAVVAANGGTASSSNPVFTFTAFLGNYKPFGASVGEKLKAPITLQPSGQTPIARAVS